MNPVPEQYLEKRFSPIWWKLLCIAWAVVGLVFMILETFNGPFSGSLYFMGFWLAAYIPVGIAAYYLKIHARKSAWEKAHPPSNRFPWFTQLILVGAYVAVGIVLIVLINTQPYSDVISQFSKIYTTTLLLLVVAIGALLKYHSRKRVPKNPA